MDCVGMRRNIWLGQDRCKLLARLQISLSLVTVALSLLPISEDSEVLCERHSAFCYRIRRAELWFTTTSSIWAAGVALCARIIRGRASSARLRRCGATRSLATGRHLGGAAVQELLRR